MAHFCKKSWLDPTKKISHVKVHHVCLERSDWLDNTKWPIRARQTTYHNL